jgi:hypothetical protein
LDANFAILLPFVSPIAVGEFIMLCIDFNLSRATIHLGVHNHLVVDGKCWELVEEIKRLIVEEVDRTPNAKIFSISFNDSKTLASYLLDDSGNGIVEFFKGE